MYEWCSTGGKGMYDSTQRTGRNDGVKFKITTTRNHRVYNSPYYRGVYLWERLPVVVQTLASKSDFRKRIKVL